MNQELQISKVADQYRKDGYAVMIHPSNGDLPSSISGYEPDIVARKDHETVVVEVTTRQELTGQDELSYIAAAINAQPAWRFDLVVVDDQLWPGPIAPKSSERSVSELLELSHASEALAAMNQIEAAILVGWSAVEAAMRWSARQASVNLERNDPQFVLDTLFSQGILGRSDYERIRSWMQVRNSLSHGLRLPRLDERLPRRMTEYVNQILASGTSEIACTQ